MSANDEILQWLQDLPLNQPVDINGQSVYLKVFDDGAELGAILIRSHTMADCIAALQMGFSSAIQYDAGLSESADGKALLLTRWLPHAKTWLDAQGPLDNLLSQVATWRAALAPSTPVKSINAQRNNEQRLRTLFAGARK